MDTVQCPSNGVYTNVEESKANQKSKVKMVRKMFLS